MMLKDTAAFLAVAFACCMFVAYADSATSDRMPRYGASWQADE